MISTDATSALVQPEKTQGSQRQACKKGHFFTAVVDCDHVLFAYAEKHTQEFVKKLFAGFTGFLQSDASNVYDILATKALGYAFNQEQELLRVLDDGRLPLDNTRSERSLRKVVVGRKNWMFYGSDTHAESAAAIFSLIASCRLHRIDPEQYLDEILRVMPYWPSTRYLELAPKFWLATRAKLRSEELSAPLCSFTVPPSV